MNKNHGEESTGGSGSVAVDSDDSARPVEGEDNPLAIRSSRGRIAEASVIARGREGGI